MTVPNLITCLRIILAPIFIIYLINDRILFALIVFIIAGLTDGLDGIIARIFNQKSDLGAYLDPLADKILLVSAFVVMGVRGYLPPWLIVVVITRDLLILLGVLTLYLTRTPFRVKPFLLSKVTTFFQLVTVFFGLAKGYFDLWDRFDEAVFWSTAVFTISSGLVYMRHWFRIMSEGFFSE